MSQPRAAADLTTRIRTKIFCFCKKCNGKLVNLRTKNAHASKYTSYAENNFGTIFQEAGPSNAKPSDNVMEYDLLPEITDPLPKVIEPLSERNYFFLTEKIPIHESAKVQIAKKGKISDLVLENLLPGNKRDKNDDQDKDSEDSEDDDEDRDSEDSEDSEDDDDEGRDSEDFEDDDDEEVEEVNFASTEFDDGEPNLPNINLDYSYTWIILWILQYQQQYKLPNVAIDSLFKFLRFFLLTIDENKFLSFPSSLHMAKKTLGISTNIIKYAACNKCHKLYGMNEILNKTEIPTCSFVNYPNHSMERFRQKCNNPLIKKN